MFELEKILVKKLAAGIKPENPVLIIWDVSFPVLRHVRRSMVCRRTEC